MLGNAWYCLQYMEKWQKFLQDISAAVGEYLLLTRVPVVEKSNSFVAIQKVYGRQMLHWQFNQDTLLKAVKDTGLSLVREFVVGDRPYIKNAPEQCELRGWLFRKIK
jgi:putative methyltransferase (TIGR04325 family)